MESSQETIPSRYRLQALLESILGSDQVFFQDPGNYRMAYPAIIYKISSLDTKHADNVPYSQTWQYEVTVMDRSPDSAVSKEISRLPKSSFSSFYTADQLNHFIYNLYF